MVDDGQLVMIMLVSGGWVVIVSSGKSIVLLICVNTMKVSN
jgi:hypothetical protein